MSGSAIAIRHGSAHPIKETDGALARLLDVLWAEYFADVPRVNEVVVGFAFPWKWRLGRIRLSLDECISEITLNGLLASPQVPDVMYIGILAHEIVHYAQGFGSPLPRCQQHAHGHGAVTHELQRRGLGYTEAALMHWGEAIWPGMRAEALHQRRTRRQPLVPSPCTITANVLY
jgi:hypothetical protein